MTEILFVVTICHLKDRREQSGRQGCHLDTAPIHSSIVTLVTILLHRYDLTFTYLLGPVHLQREERSGVLIDSPCIQPDIENAHGNIVHWSQW